MGGYYRGHCLPFLVKADLVSAPFMFHSNPLFVFHQFLELKLA